MNIILNLHKTEKIDKFKKNQFNEEVVTKIKKFYFNEKNLKDEITKLENVCHVSKFYFNFID